MSNIAMRSPAGTADRAAEDVVREGMIVRHSVSARVIHWSVAVFFIACVLTGMPIWSQFFAWMAYLFGGLDACRWLHPWFGVAFALASVAMLVRWIGDMKLDERDRQWFGPKALEYMRFKGEDPEVAKYNGGQKLFFWAMVLAMLALLVTGFVLWFPESVSRSAQEWSLVLHDLVFILATIAVIGHIYLGTAAEPGTFRAMTRGTVTKAWAKLHHGRWYRDVTGGNRRS